MDNVPENPEKPKRKRSKSIKSKDNIDKVSKLDGDEIKKILTKVIMQDMLDREVNVTRDLEINSLIATNQEFLKCFMIIGYDLNEFPVVVFQANSQLQADALSSALTKLVMSGGKMDNI
jgi:hypothetical protein